MLRINRYIVGLVLWLSFFFNIERLDLDVGNPDVFNIASPIYVVVTMIIILGILLPQWKQVPVWRYHLVAVLSFLGALLFAHRPIWGGGYTYISLFELTSVLISVSLAYMVGHLSADFVETVRSLIFSDMDDRVYRSEHNEAVIKREMQAARRGSRPLSVMLIDTSPSGAPVNMQATAYEIQQLLAKRHSTVALTRLLVRTLRRTDLLLDRTEDGRLIVIIPETHREKASAVIERLNERVQNRLGLNLRFGVASFPEQGVTFEELVYQAEQSLQPHEHERRRESFDEQEYDLGVTEKIAIPEPKSLAHFGIDR